MQWINLFMITLFIAVWIAVMVRGDSFLRLPWKTRLIIALSFSALWAGWIVALHAYNGTL